MSDTSPQDNRSVAYRALCIGALLKRHELEMRVKTLNDYLISEEDRAILISKRETLNRQLLRWLEEERLYDRLTDAEKRLLEKPLGSWSARNLMHVSWRSETLGILLWSLRHFNLIPHYDTPFEQDEVLRPLDIFTSTIDFVWCAKLRPLSELKQMRDSTEFWDWRARVMELQRLGIRPAAQTTFTDIIRNNAEQAYQNGVVMALTQGDITVFGKPYAMLSDDQYDLTRTIAQERYFAMNWISEPSSEWVSIPVD